MRFRRFARQQAVNRRFTGIGQSGVNGFLQMGLERMHGGTNNPTKMIERWGFQTLAATPVTRGIGTMTGSWIEG